MKLKEDMKKLLDPIDQLNLYGYEIYFNNFIKLFKKNSLPNSILLNSPKGMGKSTFAYHFINYILSTNQSDNYSIDNYSINPNNISYRHVCNNTHPNFFLVKNSSKEKQIKIEQIRALKKYLNHSTLSSEFKVILIDNAENLNLNSANALLKVIEEPNKNVFFILIQNSNQNILKTIKSRCIEFKLIFSRNEQEKIFKSLFRQYDFDINSCKNIYKSVTETPGNMLKIFSLLNLFNKDFSNNNVENIFNLIDIYDKNKDFEILNFVSIFIENFYTNLCKENYKSFNKHYFNFKKVLKILSDMHKFNLSDKNNLTFVKEILYYETR